MGVPTPRRTLDDIDRDLAATAGELDLACARLAPNAAELAWIRIDQLLDERLDQRTTP